MRIVEMLNTSAASATGNTIDIRSSIGITDKDTGLVQFKITTGTVNIDGRLSSDYPWYTITSATGNTATEVPLMPQMRATLSGGSGAVLVGMLVPKGE